MRLNPDPAGQVQFGPIQRQTQRVGNAAGAPARMGAFDLLHAEVFGIVAGALGFPPPALQQAPRVTLVGLQQPCQLLLAQSRLGVQQALGPRVE